MASKLRFEDLHSTVREFAKAAQAAGYTVEFGSMQVKIFSCAGKKLGGWNTQREHWYVSKIVAQGNGDLLERHGFRWMSNANGHQWWQIDGVDKVSSFRAVAAELTGVPIP